MTTRRSRAIRAGTALVVCGALGLAGCGRDGVPTDLTVRDAWARTTPAGARNGAVYFTVISPTDDAITGVSVPESVGGGAAMHTSMAGDDGGSMANMAGMDHDDEATMSTMRPLGSVALPAGKEVAFEPGQRHIMVTDLVDGLREGTTFELTLQFRRAPDRTVEVRVATNPP